MSDMRRRVGAALIVIALLVLPQTIVPGGLPAGLSDMAPAARSLTGGAVACARPVVPVVTSAAATVARSVIDEFGLGDLLPVVHELVDHVSALVSFLRQWTATFEAAREELPARPNVRT